jgi:hypothetical protein
MKIGDAKLIRFKDGRWGVKRWTGYGWSYVDIAADRQEGWYDLKYVDKYCKIDETTARKLYEALTDKGEVVEPKEVYDVQIVNKPEEAVDKRRAPWYTRYMLKDYPG